MFLVPRNLFSHVPFLERRRIRRTRKQNVGWTCMVVVVVFSRFFVCVFFGGRGCLCVVLKKWNALVCFCSTSFFVFWLGTKTRGMMRCAFSRVFLGGII